MMDTLRGAVQVRVPLRAPHTPPGSSSRHRVSSCSGGAGSLASVGLSIGSSCSSPARAHAWSCLEHERSSLTAASLSSLTRHSPSTRRCPQGVWAGGLQRLEKDSREHFYMEQDSAHTFQLMASQVAALQRGFTTLADAVLEELGAGPAGRAGEHSPSSRCIETSALLERLRSGVDAEGQTRCGRRRRSTSVSVTRGR